MRKYVFADEAGNFDFRDRTGASRFFILTTVTADSPDVGDDLLKLRRTLAWDGIALESNFHATEDAQAVRDQVFGVLVDHDFRIDTTILEKRKTQPHLAENKERFYKMAWFLHFKHVAPRITSANTELLVIAAQIGTKRRRKTMRLAIEDVVDQSTRCKWEVAFWPAESEPGLQVADYCCWAIQRKYEKADTRSYDLIEDKIETEFRPYDVGTETYY